MGTSAHDDGKLEALRRLCGGPRDGALLRVSLANVHLARGQADEAVAELRRALDFDHDYSAAWKLLGRALAESGDAAAATQAFEQGIRVAQARGDTQAAKEMTVFLRRLRPSSPA